MFSPEFPGSCSNEDRLNVFDSFWECGAPRFGETGAKGWAKVRESVQDAKPGACGLDTDQIEDQLLTAAGELVAKNRLWLEIESLREKSHFLPWRSSEEEADDPARMVPYDEISTFLFHFKVFHWSLPFHYIFSHYFHHIFRTPFSTSGLYSILWTCWALVFTTSFSFRPASHQRQ